MEITNDKIKHCISVANYMYTHAQDYDLCAEEMYIVGLLHDIGYINTIKGHARYGANLLRKMGLSENYIYAIQEHGSNLTQLSKITPELLLLVQADLQIDYKGNVVGYKDRLEDIKTRYGNESEQYLTALDSVNFLERYEVKTDE